MVVPGKRKAPGRSIKKCGGSGRWHFSWAISRHEDTRPIHIGAPRGRVPKTNQTTND